MKFSAFHLIRHSYAMTPVSLRLGHATALTVRWTVRAVAPLRYLKEKAVKFDKTPWTPIEGKLSR